MRAPFSLQMEVPHEWARIDAVRETVGSALMSQFADEEMRDALSMVCAELLENAMKYGAPTGEILLALEEQNGALNVTVNNAVEDQSPHLPTLQQRIDWLRGYADPAEAYTQALAAIYGGDGKEGGLGLVRIAYEGGCSVECETSDVRVLVRARRPLGERA